MTSRSTQEASRVIPGGDHTNATPRNPLQPSPGLGSPSPPQLGHRPPAPSRRGRWGGMAPLRPMCPACCPPAPAVPWLLGRAECQEWDQPGKNQVELVKLQALRAGGCLETLLNIHRGWKLSPPALTVARESKVSAGGTKHEPSGLPRGWGAGCARTSLALS